MGGEGGDYRACFFVAGSEDCSSRKRVEHGRDSEVSVRERKEGDDGDFDD